MMNSMKKLITLVATVFAAASVFAGEFPDISITELKAAIDAKKVTVIDANGTGSWRKGRIPTSIDFASHKGKLGKVLPNDKKALIVAYCSGPG